MAEKLVRPETDGLSHFESVLELSSRDWDWDIPIALEGTTHSSMVFLISR